MMSMFFFSTAPSFLSLMRWATKSWQGLPMTEAPTLQIHCRGRTEIVKLARVTMKL